MGGPGEVDIRKLLTRPRRFPDDGAAARFLRLVGVDERAKELVGDLHLIFNPVLAREWAERHHGTNLESLLGLLDDMVPLIVFEGDVGTGKTALAETIGDAVARENGYGVTMLKLSTQVRGTGYVGEMGTMLAAAFEQVAKQWQKSSLPVLLVIDEADSILTSRAALDHHHEDKSGVNTVLQHLDALKQDAAQVAVIAITNRVGVLDPAVMRRATAVHTFDRPSSGERRAYFEQMFTGIRMPRDGVERLVQASEPRNDRTGKSTPLSWSDLTIRFVVPAVRAAVRRDQPLALDALVEQLARLPPSPLLEVK